ncbi:unnamed protein product [Penicillium nalgiovense]|nr:unnamed protein product [Penicillium nalgiovense]CAG8210039.1 unnamed protein product [Penicillium nalgiovense]CAG8300768.1 unnamed protein product [Penicillium nalgiovense]
MATDVHQYGSELNSLLSQLARFFKTNETILSVEDCKTCLGRLPDNDRSALKKLFRILQREGKSSNGYSDKRDSHEQTYAPNFHSSPDQTGPDVSHETTPESYEEITPYSSDDGENTVDDEDVILRDTNFSRCAVKPPSSINDVLTQCIKNPHHFFTAVTRVSIPSKGGFPDAFCRVYKGQQRENILRIHRRFDLHNLYTLAVELGYHTGKKWKWGALNKVPGEILYNHPSLGLTEGKIKEHLIHYVRIGRGYGRWIEYFEDPGYLIALPLNVTETEYSKCIPAAARKLRELGIDDVVKNLELSNLGKYISQRLSLGFNPLKVKTKRVTKRKQQPNEAAAATDDRIGSSTSSPLNANQIQGTNDEPSRKRHRLQNGDFVASAPLNTSPFPTSNTNLATNIRLTDASQIQSNDMANRQFVPEGNSTRSFHGRTNDPGVVNPPEYCPSLAQLPSDSQFSDGFNALDFPNLALDTQLPPNSQLSDGFNALDFPNLALDAQLPSGSQLSDGFNALDFPNLALDTQLPPNPQLSDGFNALDFPNLALDAQIPSESHLSDGFNAMDFPGLVMGT